MTHLQYDGQTNIPAGFAHDRARCPIGQGHAAFDAAKRAFREWVPFDLGWVRVANHEASIQLGQIVAVEARTCGLWTLNLSRIAETLDNSYKFGFVYVTTEMHVEQGEERFLLELDTATGALWYDLLAVSRPHHKLALFAFPLTRSFQHRFARHSMRRMIAAVQPEFL